MNIPVLDRPGRANTQRRPPALKAATLSGVAVAVFVSLAVVIGGSSGGDTGAGSESLGGSASATVSDQGVVPPPPEVLKDLGGVHQTASFEEGLERALERASAGIDRDDLEIIRELYENDLWKESVDGVSFGGDGKVTEVLYQGSAPGVDALMEYAAGLLGPDVEFVDVTDLPRSR